MTSSYRYWHGTLKHLLLNILNYCRHSCLTKLSQRCVTMTIIVCHFVYCCVTGTALRTGPALFSRSSSVTVLFYSWWVWHNDDVMSHDTIGLIDQTTCLSTYPKSIAAFCDPTFKLMFGHFLRDTVGRGDTIDKCAITTAQTNGLNVQKQ